MNKQDDPRLQSKTDLPPSAGRPPEGFVFRYRDLHFEGWGVRAVIGAWLLAALIVAAVVWKLVT